ncbi:MAG: Cof-type HAD-IIB family hydrolase [Acidobacteriota bacterium]|nr:Cof-type HAD-IIB family hydrolase [Acidobacteriota bacterium]
MKHSIRLLAVDIDGTLLDPNFQISAANLAALRRAHAAGVEIVLGTGRRHAFAMPIAEQLGFDLWLISSNGAVTKSSLGEPFHRDLLPVATARRLVAQMDNFRGNLVVTFDKEEKGALVLERMDQLTHSIQRWLEKNEQFLEFVIPVERALVSDPIQVMFCGTVARMREALDQLAESEVARDITVLRTQYDHRDLCIVDVLNQGCSKGHALERWAAHRSYQREQVMAIGDNYNDLEMLEFAGLPVVMGNASNEMKRNGWPVTLPNDQSGVAAAIDEFVVL